MSPNTKSFAQQQQPQFYATKTELYLKVKKPLLERQRRARINKCLDTLKTLVAEFQGDDAIMRMDKAEMLESTIAFMRQHSNRSSSCLTMMPVVKPLAPMDSFRNGYMNAVNEVSRVMAAMPGMSVDVGKSVMTHLGSEFNRLLQRQPQQQLQQQQQRQHRQTIVVDVEEKLCEKVSRPSSRASSGYHSDCEHDSPMPSPAPAASVASANWRPWL